MTKDELLEKTLRILFKQAFKDKLLTDDEFEIIQNVEIGIEEYSDALKDALDDGIITQDETEKLQDLKQKILDRAKEIANTDGIIDSEESKILKLLAKILKEHFREK